jgi:GT2 family glycosyltransferase
MNYSEPLISIVFLNYNRLDETKVTVNKLLHCKNQLDYIEIIAVDNGSTDGTREYLAALGESIETILLDSNVGIEGYNKGFAVAQGDIIIVLDDDSHVDVSTIKRVKELLSSDSDIAIVAFKIVNNAGKRFNTWHLPSKDIQQESFAFVGCGFAIRKDLFKEIGFYPGDFFLYHNDVAVAIRIKLLGYKILYDPLCVAIHRTSEQKRDPSRRIYYTLRNSLVLIWMYYPFHLALYMTISRIIISFSLALVYMKGQEATRALRDFISSRPKKILLPRKKRALLKPFFYQNSIFHRIFHRPA